MARSQAPGGATLKQLYDVAGQLSPDAEINDHEISLVHDLGAQHFVEGLYLAFRNLQTAVIAQSTAFDVTATSLPEVFRILGVAVFAGTANTLDYGTVWLEEESGGTGIPLWHYTATGGTSPSIRTAGGVGVIFIPDAASASLQPNRDLIGRTLFAPSNHSRLAFRGASGAFGAGTIAFTARVLLAMWSGLDVPTGALAPIPSW